ncbi:MAG: amino acid adenylation domain-containing protein, partial [Streptosporangiaceae bacterium]
APRRELGRNPLVQVLLTVHNGPAPAASLHGLEVEPVPVERGGAQCDLSVQLRQTGDRFEGFLEFASDLFDASTLRRWWGHLTTLLSAAVAEPGTSLSELPCLTAAEIAQVAVEWNQNEAPFDDVLLHDIVSRQAAATPEAPALVWDGGSLSYAEYERRADALADVLRNWGVGPEVPVALYLERDADLMVAVLGVLKAGGAYLPLNLSYPQERIELMLDDARPAVLLTQRRLADRVPSGWPVVLVDDLPSAPAGTTEVSTSNLAYVIYTSGSTGRPKGVMAQHRSATELLAWQQRRYPIGSGDVVLLKTPVSFDVSVPELFWWALAGARLALLPEGAEKDPRALVETIRRHGVTMVNFVPSMFGPFLELLEADPELAADAASLRQIFCAGEALPIEQVRRFHRVFDGSATKLVNLYGPTETSVWNSSFDCAPETTRVLIGRPRDNTGFYLLDSHGRLQPVGVPGELCISGESITRGYLDRPGLTADRYVPHPFAGTHGVPPGARMYRTGDLARFTSDGSVEWIGRLDLQVKVRGFRVELGEITAALRAHPAVGSAVVVLREGRLAAYYTGGAELTVPELTVTELRGFLRRTLPDHMVPESFTPLGVLPVTTSGKVDTAALPEPDGSRPVLGTAYVAPGTPLEKVVAGIWAEVLRVDRAGAQDDFFDLGGNSLLATQVTSALRENLGVEIPLRVMFEAPTVAAQAELVGAAGREASLDLGTIAELYLQVQELSDDQVRELLAVQEG